MKLSRWAGHFGRVALAAALVGGVASCSHDPQPTWAPPTLGQASKALDNVSFRAFVETSERLYLLRFPQTISELGRAQELGVRNGRLDDLSPRYRAETAAIEREILTRLGAYRRAALPADDQVVYDAEKAVWTERVALQATPAAVQAFGLGDDSWNDRLVRRLSSADGVRSESDLVDQITCLYQAARQVDWMRRALIEGARGGNLPPRDSLLAAIVPLSELRITETVSESEYLPPRIIAAGHPFFRALFAKAMTLADVPAEERTALLRDANRVVADEIIPAYERLAKTLLAIVDELPAPSSASR